jgi:hypothetical protein
MSEELKIICINKKSYEEYLTLFKIYTTVKVGNYLYAINDDTNKTNGYMKDRFKLLNEYRREIIQLILE